MTQPPILRTRARARVCPGLVALCLVALELVTALHFALVPHAFNAAASGFVHVHGRQTVRSARLARRVPSTPTLVGASASCAAESCPIGFAGQHSILLSSRPATGLLAFVVNPDAAAERQGFAQQRRVLLAAPKTSPPV